MGPRLAIDRPDQDLRDWRMGNEALTLSMVDPAEVGEVRSAMARAESEGSYLWGEIYHCAIGTKP